MTRTKPFFEYSGTLWMPQDDYDRRCFESGRDSFLSDEGFHAPFPGADTWADMMTNQGWVYESRKVNQ